MTSDSTDTNHITKIKDPSIVERVSCTLDNICLYSQGVCSDDCDIYIGRTIQSLRERDLCLAS